MFWYSLCSVEYFTLPGMHSLKDFQVMILTFLASLRCLVPSGDGVFVKESNGIFKRGEMGLRAI